MDSVFSACGHLAGCAYVDCKAEQNDVERDDIVDTWEQYDTRQPCEGERISTPGQLDTPQGTIPYEWIETRFEYRDDSDCLSGIDVAFMIGSQCYLNVQAMDYVDAQGRYLIKFAGAENEGSCPDYPAWLGDSYSEAAEGEPLGTITVDRPPESWDECVEGTLVVSFDVVLSGTPETSTDVDLTGVSVSIPGYFSKTDTGGLADCPLVSP